MTTMNHRRLRCGISSSSNAIIAGVLMLIVGIVIPDVQTQENAQTRIPASLAECYENPDIYERDNRLPSTINTLIELIRKIEDSPEYTQDLRQVATGILHRFRLDGIERAPGYFQQSVLPFSPSGYQFSKHRLLLSRLIPGNAFNFPNNTLSTVERCALHFLISTSIDTQVRGDEASRCGQLAQYRAQRVPMDRSGDHLRMRRNVAVKSNFVGDVEMMDDFMRYRLTHREHKKVNRYSAIGNETDEEDSNEGGNGDDTGNGDEFPDDEFGDPSLSSGYGLVDVASNAISQCPVENGVIRTTWGTISVGPLLAGIAAGVVQQSVTTRELLLLTKAYSHGRRGGRQQTLLSVDNRWAATLAGDLAEVALLQGPMTRDVNVGASGAWNSTAVPRWYFLSQRERLEMTDAEIRGGIDGMVLALNIQNWRSQASQLRLSQVLDMYYSQRGVFSSDIKSCNRRSLFTQNAPIAQLQAQTTAFSTVLDREMQLRVTLSNDAIRQFSSSAAQALTTHVANGLNDVTCEATSTYGVPTTQTATDVHIFIDASWQFYEIQPVIATLLENLEVSRFGSRVTIYNANDASIIVNTTYALSDFYTQWNATVAQHQMSGLNLPNILKQLKYVGQTMLDVERARSSVGGRSFVSLIVPQMSGVSESDSNFAREQIVILREIIPDLTLLFMSGGSFSRFENFVRDRQRDLFPLMSIGPGPDSGQQVLTYVRPVIQRIQSVPRRIINPRCNSNWQQNEWGSNTMEEYVAPDTINYYRLHPNYFFQSGGYLRIQGRGYSHIFVCSSRWVERPRRSNSTQPQENVNCRQLLPTDNFDIELTNACSGYYLIQNCPPFYVSVEGVLISGQTNLRCTEQECRYPDSIRYGVTVENLGCYSGANRMANYASATLLTAILLNILMIFRN